MNKGIFFQQRVVAKVVGRREGGAVGGRLRHGREPDRKNRCWDWSWIPLWMPRPGTIRDRSKATDWQPATSTATQGVAYARNLLGERSLFILFLGHYPWDPAHLVPSSIFAKDPNFFQLCATCFDTRPSRWREFLEIVIDSNFSCFVVHFVTSGSGDEVCNVCNGEKSNYSTSR